MEIQRIDFHPNSLIIKVGPQGFEPWTKGL